VKRRKTQVAGLCKGHRVVHGLQGSYFSDHDDIRCLSKRVFERYFEAGRIHPDFTLRHHAASVFVYKFDRVLNRDDVAFRILVSIPNHRSKRRGFTSTCCTNENNQSTLSHGELFNRVGEHQVLYRWNLGLDSAQHHTGKISLVKSTYPESASYR
jgi:hypothetical protein